VTSELTTDQHQTAARTEADAVTGSDDIHATLIAAVSHDLRTPLSAARTALDGLSDRTVRWTTEDQAALLATAHASLAQISRLVEGLLDANRIQHRSGAVSFRPTALANVARAAVATVPQADQLAIDVPTGLPDVITDPMLLERVIANVVANAVRHSPPGMPPRLAAHRHGSWVELHVIDQGPGVPKTQWEHLFQPFESLGEARSATRSGLGLAISHTLANAIGATLRPEATAGGGLTMVIALPLVHQDPRARHPMTPQSNPNPNRRHQMPP
jgi:two-component system, OmpR family, sensor histidine kinase KdpD